MGKESIAKDVKSKLFETAQYFGEDVLKESVKAILPVLNCTECSLWSINHNSTQDDGENKEFISTSLICRECNDSYVFRKGTDFVHDLKDGLFKHVIHVDLPECPVYIFQKEEALECGYRSWDFVEKCGLNTFVVFTIYCEDKPIALLEISYKECGFTADDWKELSSIIRPFFSSALVRYAFVKKQSLISNLIECHRKNKNKKVPILFSNILNGVLLKACPSQGASIFIWDNYQNRFNLIATTGLVGDPDSNDVFYQLGDGRTGHIGQSGIPLITDDITKEEAKNGMSGLFREKLKDDAKTEMFIPIKNPSNEKEVIGVFRMVNKKNVSYDSTIDYFNDADVEIMMDASEYLALIIANYQKEEIQYEFIDKLTHEFITPANAIWKTANRLYSHMSDVEFMNKNLSPYLENIIDFSELQRWQASTNLFLSRTRKKMPFDVRYNPQPTSLAEVIRRSIDIAIPIARKYNVPFRNIYINSNSSSRLTINIDRDAFVTVFYNLFTNAIKYHDPNAQDQFYIDISYVMDVDNLYIHIKDNGIGINAKEQYKIFGRGYRSESAIRINASGYGIGLTVCKQIVEDFGGDIKITSLKKPTIFRIRLPKKIINNHETI